MSGQMNLLAPPSEGPIEVPICRSVLYAGASAHADYFWDLVGPVVDWLEGELRRVAP